MQYKESGVTSIHFTLQVQIESTAVDSADLLIVYPDDLSLSFEKMGSAMIVSQGQLTSGTTGATCPFVVK